MLLAPPAGETAGGGSVYVTSLQKYNIAFSSGQASTLTLDPTVSTALTAIFPGGTTAAATAYDAARTHVRLVNSSSVRLQRELNTTADVGGRGTVVEFTDSLVESVQHGAITIASGSTSGTATLASSVNASRSIVIFLGQSTTSTETQAADSHEVAVELTDGSTVTAFVNTSGFSHTIRYQVVQFAAGTVTRVQQFDDSYSGGDASNTKTITAVDPDNSFIINNGVTTPIVGSDVQRYSYYLILTDSTTVTINWGGPTATQSRRPRYTVVEFEPGILASPPQQGSVTLNNVASNTATLGTAVDTSKSVILSTGNSCNTGTSNWNTMAYTVELTNASTVTARVHTAVAGTNNKAGYVVLEFA